MVSILKRLMCGLILCGCAIAQANLPSGTTASGTINYKAIAAPSTPASGRLITWSDSTSKIFCGKNDAGTLSCTVVPSSAPSHQFFNSLSAGVFGSAQPAFSDISGTLGCSQFPTITGDASNSACAFTITALHLSPAPTLCSSGNYARGIDANGNATGCTADSITGGNYQTIENNGVNKPQEPTLHLLSGANATVSCNDTAGVSTDCTVNTNPGGTANLSSVWTGLNLAASKALNTIYQDTSGHPLIVEAFLATNGTGAYTLLVGSSNPPTTAIFSGSSSSAFALEIYGLVLNSQFYEITGTAGSVNVWDELTITKGAITSSSDLVGSRSYTTVFQNTTGNVVWLLIQIGTGGTSQIFSDTNNPPTTEVWKKSITGGTSMSAFVPILNGNFYKITNNGTGTLSHWYEYQWDTVTAQQASPSFTETWSHGCCTHNYFNGFGTSLWVRLSAPGTNTGTLIVQHHFSTLLSSDVVTATAFADCEESANGGADVRSCAVGLNALETYAPFCDSTTCTMSDWTEYSFK